jgi:hypothetical protein
MIGAMPKKTKVKTAPKKLVVRIRVIPLAKVPIPKPEASQK